METPNNTNNFSIDLIQWLPLQFVSVHFILATNILFTFIYELMGQELTDNVYINIHVFPVSPLKAKISKNQKRFAYDMIYLN